MSSQVKHLAKALSFLTHLAASPSYFPALASKDPVDFRQAHTHPTVFFNALILECLHNIAGSELLQSDLATYLLRHKSPDWTWNYWERGAPTDTKQTYPDDLDDTACSLGALYHYNPELIDGHTLGRLANILIATESQPGGPYNTWIINISKWVKWRDLDLAVNANVAWVLSQQDVHLSALESYFDTAIKMERLTSTYYLDTIPCLYFLARWYDGQEKKKLEAIVKQYLQTVRYQSEPLWLAMLLSSGCYLNLGTDVLSPVYSQLTNLQRPDGSWQAQALYYEPLEKGVRYYAGSEALTTAMALQAINMYINLGAPKLCIPPPKTAQLDSLNAGTSLPRHASILKKRYQQAMKAIIDQDRDQQITAMATTMAQACRQSLSFSVLDHLNQASLNGWIAYNIYDDILDNEPRPEDLGVANYALRTSLQHFLAALPKNQAFQQHVHDTFTLIDEANSWELANARATYFNSSLRISLLPLYGSHLSSLWQRSWGHSLAASGVFCALGYPLESSEQRNLLKFFKHFLIARQLNDDAHDWEEDLQSGHLSVVVTMLLKSYFKTDTGLHFQPKRLLAKLRVHFWRAISPEISDLIEHHIHLAEQALKACLPLANATKLTTWLQVLRQATKRAQMERDETEKFISSYQQQQ